MLPKLPTRNVAKPVRKKRNPGSSTTLFGGIKLIPFDSFPKNQALLFSGPDKSNAVLIKFGDDDEQQEEN